MDLGGWLRSLGLEQYEAAFARTQFQPSSAYRCRRKRSLTCIHHLRIVDLLSSHQRAAWICPAHIPWQGKAQTLAVSLLKVQSRLDRNADGSCWQSRKETTPRTEEEGLIGGVYQHDKYCT